MIDPQLLMLEMPPWSDYALLDSGNGSKLERYGRYTFVRPEAQAIWQPALPSRDWDQAHAVFQPVEDHGNWDIRRPLDRDWIMDYDGIRFRAQPTPFRHMGVFPEQASHWSWADALIRQANRPINVLNLFGYTGMFSLVAAKAGAQVTHLDASKKSMDWARENQRLAGLEDAPIRWMIDDVIKFVQREVRRGRQYDGLIIDPPKYGRGPKGEIWKIYESLPELLDHCQRLLSPQPLFVVLTTYAVRISPVSLHYLLVDLMREHRDQPGTLTCGELLINETSAGRKVSTSMYARWNASR